MGLLSEGDDTALKGRELEGREGSWQGFLKGKEDENGMKAVHV